jgi:Baseplate J-like protein
MSTSAPCPCETTQDPQVVTNPPNLPTIAYRVDDFTGFRRALLQSPGDETALAGWRPVAGDLGLQVLEWWAYLADILTFYNERIANEDYLGTAQLAASVTRLVALLGYQPRPGIAATGAIAALRSARNQQEPLVIAQGTQFANQATPGVPVQTYEALSTQTFPSPVSNTTVIPSPDLSLPHLDPGTGASSVLLAGKVSGLVPGESLLLLRRGWTGADENWAQVTVASVSPEVDPYGATNTRVSFSSIVWGLQMPPPGATTIIEVAQYQGFGYFAGFDPASTVFLVDPLRDDPPPAPPESDPQIQNYRLLRSVQSAALWSAGDPTTTGSYDAGTFGVRLSAVVRSFSPGDPVLFTDASTGGAVMAIVAGTSEEFLTVPYPGPDPPNPPTIPVSHTVLTLTLPSATDADSLVDLSSTATLVRHAFRDVGTMIPSPATALPPLPATFTAGTALPTLNGALAFLEDATGAGIPVSATTGSGGTSVTLAATTQTLSSPSLQLPVALLIDLVPISQGTTVANELLGTGNASLANQTFTLSKSPLTYLPQGASYVSALQVAVDGIYWTEVASLYGQAAVAQVFTVAQQSDGTSVIRFGDGSAGARLPTGSQVVATYRYGSGAASPPAGRLTTILKPQTNLTAVHNPVAVVPGSDPEPPSSVRSAAPASVLTFGRAISADDYVTIAQRTPGIDRARAYWTWDADSQRAVIKIYVGDGAAAVALATNALAASDDPNRPVSVVAATPIELGISCGLVIAPDAVADDVLAAAQSAVVELFAPINMAIGQLLYSSQIEAALMVPGATAVQGLQVLEPGRIRFERAGFLAPEFLRFLPVVPIEAQLFTGPVGVADPGEGGYFTLSATPSISQVTSGG